MTGSITPPPVADGLEHALDPRHMTLGRVAGLILTGVISIVGFAGIIIWIFAASPPAILVIGGGVAWLAGTLILVWWTWRWPEIEHRHAFWRLDGEGIAIREGVVWRREITVPRSRVQHTDVSQGPLERSLGLGTLIIFTAGTEHARIELKGLAHPIALGIRDHLLPREKDDAV